MKNLGKKRKKKIENKKFKDELKRKQKQERDELLRMQKEELAKETVRVTKSTATAREETQEEKDKRIQLSSKCKDKANELRAQRESEEATGKSTSWQSANNKEDEEDKVVIVNDENIGDYAKDIRTFIKEEMDAQGGHELPMDVLRVRVRGLLQELSGSSQIEEKHIERVIFLSDSEER